MKRFFYITFSILCLTGCSNGLNKSILEPLEVNELKKLMKADSTFTNFYKDAQELRTLILKSDVHQAKYGDVTYKRLKKFENKIADTTFVNKLLNSQREEYKLLYPDYTSEVDSLMTYWNDFQNEHSLDSLVSVSFKELWKEYYSYSGDVRSVNIGFEVSPLKGTIQQLIFRYCIKSKISNDGKMSTWDSHRCLASSPISKTKTLYWEADYSDEKYLKNMSSESVIRDYDFIIEIVEVRIGGENMSERLESMPKYVRYALDDNDLDGGIWKDDIIKECINPEYVSFWTYAEPKLNEEIKKIDPLVYELLHEDSDSNDD